MKRMFKYLAAATAVLLPAAWAWAAPAVVMSPDGKITIRIEDDASRLGGSWYLGAMTADDGKDGGIRRVSLGFLPPGRYRAAIWEDGAAVILEPAK